MQPELPQTLIRFGMRQIVSDVREPRPARFQPIDQRERLVNGLMHRMRNVAKRVENEFVKVFEQGGGRIWQRTEIRKIGRAPKTKSKHPEFTVQQRNGHNRNSDKFHSTVQDVEFYARNGAERRPVVKHIGKRAPQDVERLLRAVDRQRRLLANIERANVVEAEDMVRMAVGQQNGIETVETGAQSLLAKIRCCVDDHVFSMSREQQRRAQPVVVGVFRSAYAAMAAQRRHAHRGAGTENGYLYGSRGHDRSDGGVDGVDPRERARGSLRGAFSLWLASPVPRP